MSDEENPPRALLSVPLFDGGPQVSGFVAAHDDDEQSVTMTYDDLPGPSWSYHVTGRMVRGKVAITELAISQRAPDSPWPISQAELRKAPLGILLDRVKSSLRVAWQNRVPHLLAQSRTHLPKQGRSRPPEHYIQVAWYYTYAMLTGRAPRKVVANHWGVSPVTASRWLAEARRRGYLSSYKPGVRLGRDPNYPKAPEEHAESGLKIREAHKKTEQHIFVKVLREEILDAFERGDSDRGQQSIISFMIEAIRGNSDGARQIRADICVRELLRLAEEDADDQVRKAADDLLEKLGNTGA